MHLKQLGLGLVTGIIWTLSTFCVEALEIPRNRLLNKPLTLKVAPGVVTAIRFETGETIEHFLLSDDTKLVYTTDAPPRQATTYLLRQIKPDPTYGATQTNVPNLLITTRTPDGSTYFYQFWVSFVEEIHEKETVIRVVNPRYRPEEQVLMTPQGEATLIDVENGLQHILQTGQASSTEPEVQQIQSFLVLARQMPLEEAASTAQISLDILTKLGEIGLKNRHESLRLVQ